MSAKGNLNVMHRFVILGATGAVGGQCVKAAQACTPPPKLTLLNRRTEPALDGPGTTQHAVDVFDPATYRALLFGHSAAICTFGVGQPSKTSEAEFVRVDKEAVITFARACKDAGIAHFSILSAVGANAASRSRYLRVKGELNDALVALRFDRLSIFQPSMILTPTNRYGASQGLMLAVWPTLSPVLRGALTKYRGIDVQILGTAMVRNACHGGRGVDALHWAEITKIAAN